ncbi:MAG: NUDIX hydrolase, partial [Clostridia bacterium]|nr:NUDIX hydrolase [Clostridia bacterium]
MDIGFINKSGQFRLRACAVIIEDGCVLMVRNDRDDYYYSVGGGVKQNESSTDAVVREVFE